MKLPAIFRLSVARLPWCILALSPAAQGAPPIAAPSISLVWAAPSATWFYNEATVRRSTRGSSFIVCHWDMGYLSIEELKDGRKIAGFGVWDPARANNPNNLPLEKRVEVLQKGDRVEISRQGGAAPSARCEMPFHWQIGERVRCFVQATIEGEKTAYAGWLWLPTPKMWRHLATIRVTTGGKSLSGLASFVEDDRRDTKSVKDERRCEFGNGWVKAVDGAAQPLTRGTFTGYNRANEAQDLMDAGQAAGGLFLENGGKVNKTNGVGVSLEITPVQPLPPADLPVK